MVNIVINRIIWILELIFTNLFMLARITGFISLLCFTCVNTGKAAKVQLDAKLTTLETKTNQLSVDQAAAFSYLKNISNLSSGALLTENVTIAGKGDTINLPLNIVPGTAAPVSLQVDLTLPTGVTFISVSPGPAAIAANKSVSSGLVNGNQRIIVFGVNQTVIGQGVLLNVTVKVATTALSLSSIGLVNPVASDANGNAIIISTISGTVKIQ